MRGRTTKLLAIMALRFIAFSGCAPKQEPLTPEQQAMRTKMMQAMVERLQNSQAMPAQTPAPAPAQQLEQRKVYTESELASIAGVAPILDQAINFEKKRDGFTINGVRYFDPEGEIANFGANSLTGEVSYFVKTGGRSLKTFVIKYMKAKSSDAPITLAYGTVGEDYIKLKTATGRVMTGKDGFNTSKGFVILREETGFLYTVGKGITSFAAPDGYHIAKYQQGDLESTGFVLLEKNKVASSHKANPIMGIVESASSLGSALGINEKNDYALMNVKSGKLVELNISYDKAARNNPLFMENGLRNSTHYFWRIRWFKGLHGIYALYQPNASKKKALELNTGKEKTLFDSIIGSVDWKAEYIEGNKLKITEIKQLGTGDPEVIDDFETFFQREDVAAAVK
jgi:hypothetical protein